MQKTTKIVNNYTQKSRSTQPFPCKGHLCQKSCQLRRKMPPAEGWMQHTRLNQVFIHAPLQVLCNPQLPSLRDEGIPGWLWGSTGVGVSSQSVSSGGAGAGSLTGGLCLPEMHQLPDSSFLTLWSSLPGKSRAGRSAFGVSQMRQMKEKCQKGSCQVID